MKKIPVWKNVILIVSLVVAILVATFAWFVRGPYGSVQQMDVDVGEASYIQISGDDGEHWSEELEVEIGLNNKFKELSGNGTALFAPVYDVIEKETGGYYTDIVAFEQVTDDEKYFEQIITVRSDSAHDVYLSSESFVKAVSEQESYISGAIRVAFFELDENDNETLKYIWAPNSTIEYSADTNSFIENGNVEPYYYYQIAKKAVDIAALDDSTTDPYVAKIPTADPENPEVSPACGYNEAYQFMWSSGDRLPENTPLLLSFSASEGANLASKRLKVRVWLEGYDRECVSLLNGQKFTMKFQFDADKGE